MGAKSSKLKSKKNKAEDGACGEAEAEGQKEEQVQEQLKEGDALVDKKPEENGTVKKESEKIEEGDKSEENKEIAQTLIVTESVTLTSEKSPVGESVPPPTEASSDSSPPQTAEEVNVEATKETDGEQNVENDEETEQSEQSAQKQLDISETGTVSEGTSDVPTEPAIEEEIDTSDKLVVEEKTEDPVQPITAEEEPVQPEESLTIEPSVTAEELIVDALSPEDLPPPPPTPAETEEVESASAQQDQHAVITDEGDITAAAPSDTAESGAATSEVTDTTEAETAAPSEEPATAIVVTEFKWEGPGETVHVSGTFNNWQENIPLIRNGDIFTKTLDLPIGEYLYKFLVDEQWMVNKTMPIKCDENGEENNFLIVELIS